MVDLSNDEVHATEPCYEIDTINVHNKKRRLSPESEDTAMSENNGITFFVSYVKDECARSNW